KRRFDVKDAIPSLSAIRVGLMGSCPSRYVHVAPQRIDARAITRRPTLDGGSGVLKQKRAWNRGERHRGYDDDGAGDADGVAEEPCSGRRDSGRPDRDRVEHAEEMRAALRCGIVWHGAVDHGRDAVKHKTDER